MPACPADALKAAGGKMVVEIGGSKVLVAEVNGEVCCLGPRHEWLHPCSDMWLLWRIWQPAACARFLCLLLMLTLSPDRHAYCAGLCRVQQVLPPGPAPGWQGVNGIASNKVEVHAARAALYAR